MFDVEAVLGQLSIFGGLRPDEIGRLAARFQVEKLAAGQARSFAATPAEARMIVVVHGHVDLEVDSAAGKLHSRLEPGDRHGDIALLAGTLLPVRVVASDGAATLATLDRAGLDAILDATPAVALPLASELASELHTRQDVERQLMELHAEGLPPEQLRAAVDERRRALSRRGARVVRTAPAALFRRLIVQKGAEPPFWMLAGFIVALAGARLTVFFILHFHLESQLFALVKTGNDPNPMHVHHFNYGLVLVGLSGLAALFPFGRKALRVLAAMFGAGMGLIFDEFALFWNLNPNYAQEASLVAAGAAVVVLVQLVWFRRFWVALARRGWLTLRGAR
jgi:CRP-like cAMP-binding protein